MLQPSRTCLIVIAMLGFARLAAAEQDFSARLLQVRGAILAPGGAKLQINLSSQERDLLVDLLRDQDPKVRESALRALKHYAGQTSQVRDRILERYEDRNEEEAVRIQAAKTLSFTSHDNRVQDKLLDTAQSGSESPALRAISYKALYLQTAGTTRIRDKVLEAARYESDGTVRRAAIWALFAGSGDSRVRDRLLEMARHDSDEDIRVEALKSLYGAMTYNEVRDRVRDMARYNSEPKAVRRSAILLLSAIISSDTRDTLQDLARRESDPELRQAAILALDPTDERIIRHFHLIRRTNNGQFIDPLENE